MAEVKTRTLVKLMAQLKKPKKNPSYQVKSASSFKLCKQTVVDGGTCQSLCLWIKIAVFSPSLHYLLKLKLYVIMVVRLVTTYVSMWIELYIYIVYSN